MPFDNITGKHFDSGDYPACLRRVAEAIDIPAVRRRQAEATGVERIGLGFSIFCEQGAHGTSVYAGWGIPMVPGFEQATARLTPDGGLELRVGVHSHGQGLETTLAQVAHEILGIPLAAIRLVHGDTAMTPYSTGTWGSRCIVMAGGAVASACTELASRIGRIGAHLLQAAPDDGARRQRRRVRARPARSRSARSRAPGISARRTCPPTSAPGGLEVTAGYKTARDSGTFSYAAHAAVVAVDTEIGAVASSTTRSARMAAGSINPMIVDGQVLGGAAQGHRHRALRGDAVRPARASRSPRRSPTTAAGRDRGARRSASSTWRRRRRYTVSARRASAKAARSARRRRSPMPSTMRSRPLGVAIAELPITPRRILAALLARRR